MNIGKGFFIAPIVLLVCLVSTACSQRTEEVKDEPLPTQPLESPTAFMLSIAERAWLGEQAKIRCDTAEALAQAGEAGRARKVCELALDTAEAIKNWNETSAGGGFSYVTPLGRVAAVLARAGDSQKALSITSKIDPCGRKWVL